MDIKDKYRNLSKRGKRSHVGGEAADAKASNSKEYSYQHTPYTTSDTVKQPQLDLKSTGSANDGQQRSGVSPKQAQKGMIPKEGVNFSTNHSGMLPKPTMEARSEQMTLTIYNEKKNLVVSLKGSLLGSALVDFAKKEFKVQDPIVLHSKNEQKFLELGIPIIKQVPQFDLLQIMRDTRSEIFE